MSPLVRSLAAGILALPSTSAHADLLWDNNLTPNGFNGRALSPPLFAIMGVADDFVVFDDGGWVIEEFGAAIIEDAGWIHGDRVELSVYEDTDGFGPGDRIVHVNDTFRRKATGEQYFGRDAYEYWMENLEIELEQGTYWIGLRNPNGRGSGTNYWLTSDGGRDGGDSDTGYFSLDGDTWSAEGEGWHHGFQIRGVPEPGAFMLMLTACVLLLRGRAPRV